MHVITGFQIMAFTPKEKFPLMAIIDAIPTKWRHHLKMCNNYQNYCSVSNSAQLHLNGHNYYIRLDSERLLLRVEDTLHFTKERWSIILLSLLFSSFFCPLSSTVYVSCVSTPSKSKKKKKHAQRSPLKGRDYANRTVKIF